MNFSRNSIFRLLLLCAVSSRDQEKIADWIFHTLLSVKENTLSYKWKQAILKGSRCTHDFFFPECKSPNYLNTLLISSVVFLVNISSKGWQKFQVVNLGTVAITAGFVWSQTCFLEMICPFDTSIIEDSDCISCISIPN